MAPPSGGNPPGPLDIFQMPCFIPTPSPPPAPPSLKGGGGRDPFFCGVDAEIGFSDELQLENGKFLCIWTFPMTLPVTLIP